MKKNSTWLWDCRRDVFSQTGEDGVISKVLELLPLDNWCVEFGAWDGLHLSNTANLVLNKNFSVVFIESDAARLNELKNNYAGNDRVIALHKAVGFDESDGLDAILEQTPIPREFDVLSIDIDGNDYHAWRAVTKYHPKVVCVEFNPTIPTEVEFIQEKGARVRQGCSLSALAKLGKEKGYELVCALPWNAIFVRRDFFSAFEIEDNRPQTLRGDTSYVTHIFSGYDGTVFLSGARRLPWHGLSLDASRMQVVPWFLRRYQGDYSLPQRIAAKLYFSLCGNADRAKERSLP